MTEKVQSTKEILINDLGQAKEVASNLKLKIENPEELKAIAEADLGNIQVTLDDVNNKISVIESQIASLPESGDESEENAELEEIKQQLTIAMQTVTGQMEKYFAEGVSTVQVVEHSSENKEGFAEGHIMNPNMLDKIAQLEAINADTLTYSQERYDNYINNQAKYGKSTVGKNQEKFQKEIDMGDEPSYYDHETIYGTGGMNRYIIDDEGNVVLARGGMVESGTEEYKAALEKKALELGIKVGTG